MYFYEKIMNKPFSRENTIKKVCKSLKISWSLRVSSATNEYERYFLKNCESDGLVATQVTNSRPSSLNTLCGGVLS